MSSFANSAFSPDAFSEDAFDFDSGINVSFSGNALSTQAFSESAFSFDAGAAPNISFYSDAFSTFALSDQAFSFDGVSALVALDTHDGDYRRAQRARHAKQREDKRRLRALLESFFEEAPLAVVREAAQITPHVHMVRTVPVVQWDALMATTRQLRELVALVRAWERENDDEEALTVLMH